MNRKNLNDLKKIFLIQIYNFKTIVKKAGIIQKRFVSHIYFAFISKFFFLYLLAKTSSLFNLTAT